LLEAFGNAQTVINDNSSRFAKLYELMFSQQGRLVGGMLHPVITELELILNLFD
jgi:myosin heavy subunit